MDTPALNYDEALALFRQEMVRALRDLPLAPLGSALDGAVRGLGLALQLSPDCAQQALATILSLTERLSLGQNTEALSTWGPALVAVAVAVRESDVTRDAPHMQAWATAASEVGLIIGELGLALALPPQRRGALLDNLQSRAQLLDEATAGRLSLCTWLAPLISSGQGRPLPSAGT